MKKLLAVCACTVLSLSLSGCSLGTVLEQITSTGDVSVEEPSSPESAATEPKSRVYMDEISGTLQDFSGSQLILNKGEASYVFNLSGATLECKDGMITGDEISVIYEGQLSGTDASTVQTLKVVDEFHRKSKLKKRTAHGQVLSLTANTITLKSKKGKTATYPITGTEQYYQNILQILPAGSSTVQNLDMSSIPVYFKGGIAPGSHVNVTYKGVLQPDTLEGIQILAVTGEDPDTIDDKHISFTVTGVITGSTANTITVQTDDGAVDTFRTEELRNSSEASLEYGDYVQVTFHPSKSKASNIYTAVQIQNA